MNTYVHVTHNFGPVYDGNSRILILGSFPSVKSREQGFYYGHPRNRFWKVMSFLLKTSMPQSIDDKKSMLLDHHAALWDVAAECDIAGSSDTSITNVRPNDLSVIVQAAPISRIYTNGHTAGNLYHRYEEDMTGIPAVVLPSTSPANASWDFDRLVEAWSVILDSLL